MRLVLWLPVDANSQTGSLVATWGRIRGCRGLVHALAYLATALTLQVGLVGEALHAAEVKSHAPMRTLPEPLKREREAGPALFVDAQRGDARE